MTALAETLPAGPGESFTRRVDRRHQPTILDRSAAYAFSELLDLRAPDRLVLAVLLHRAGAPHGEAWPTIGEIAERTALEPRTVTTILRRHEARGMLTTTLQRSSASRYRLNVPSIVAPVVGRSLDLALSPSTLTTTERATLAVVLMHTGASGEAWPGHARIASMAGLSLRAVGSALKRLVARGMLTARQVKPGGMLPSGATASGWVTVLRPTGRGPGAARLTLARMPREGDDPGALSPRSSCGQGAIVVPGGDDPGAEEGIPGTIPVKEERPCFAQTSRPTVPAPITDAIDLLLEEYAQQLEIEDLGRDAERVMRERVAEASIADAKLAIVGIAATPWRMEQRSRRTVLAALGTSEKFAGFVAKGRATRETFGAIAVAEMIEIAPSAPIQAPPIEVLRARASAVASLLAGLAPPQFVSPE